MIKVNSTNLSAVGYDSETNLLTIEFNDGGLYEYYTKYLQRINVCSIKRKILSQIH